eukprot:2907687-Prymnesium_polylepis.1
MRRPRYLLVSVIATAEMVHLPLVSVQLQTPVTGHRRPVHSHCAFPAYRFDWMEGFVTRIRSPISAPAV